MPRRSKVSKRVKALISVMHCAWHVTCRKPDEIPGGSSQPPDSIYEMSIISTRCLQKKYVGRSYIKSGKQVRSSMPACGDEPGLKES